MFRVESVEIAGEPSGRVIVLVWNRRWKAMARIENAERTPYCVPH